jgi:hypothetical protein
VVTPFWDVSSRCVAAVALVSELDMVVSTARAIEVSDQARYMSGTSNKPNGGDGGEDSGWI